jgi:hypothetical protein
LPDSFLILTSTANAVLFQGYGGTIGLSSFPSLPNAGSVLSLVSKEGRTIHAVGYSDDWYQNTIKKEGGWALEMIDTKNPCAGEANWKASTENAGGTPGRKNAVDALNTDGSPPRLFRTYSPDSVSIAVLFDEPLDSITGSVASNYVLSNGGIVLSAYPQPPLFDEVILRLSSPMQKNIVYELTVHAVTDCKGNGIGIYNKARAGIGEEAAEKEVAINEILFNPRPGAFDYVELYNMGQRIIDASSLFIGNRTSSGMIASVRKLSELPFNIFPGDYIVVTEDRLSLRHEYLVRDENAVLPLSLLPSYADDKGVVVLTNSQGNLIDEVSYLKEWHFALISDAEGVALERIDPKGESQQKGNWHSAAATAGYGTPGYQNSQFRETGEERETVEVNPKIFSPDNDGHDDVLTISCRLEESGYVASIVIFNAGGTLVKHLVRNDLLGFKARWNWDGLDEKNAKLPAGVYIVYTEIFNGKGRKKRFRNTVVLSGKS